MVLLIQKGLGGRSSGPSTFLAFFDGLHENIGYSGCPLEFCVILELLKFDGDHLLVKLYLLIRLVIFNQIEAGEVMVYLHLAAHANKLSGLVATLL